MVVHCTVRKPTVLAACTLMPQGLHRWSTSTACGAAPRSRTRAPAQTVEVSAGTAFPLGLCAKGLRARVACKMKNGQQNAKGSFQSIFLAQNNQNNTVSRNEGQRKDNQTSFRMWNVVPRTSHPRLDLVSGFFSMGAGCCGQARVLGWVLLWLTSCHLPWGLEISIFSFDLPGSAWPRPKIAQAPPPRDCEKRLVGCPALPRPASRPAAASAAGVSRGCCPS